MDHFSDQKPHEDPISAEFICKLQKRLFAYIMIAGFQLNSGLKSMNHSMTMSIFKIQNKNSNLSTGLLLQPND